MNTPIKSFRIFVRTLLCGGSFLFTALTTLHAGSARWTVNPATGDWNSATNWTPSTVPNGPSDTATFDSSNTVDVSVSAGAEISALISMQTRARSLLVLRPAFY